ncbi:MAG: hypothetical protein WCL16_12210, partial [bacterium]
ETIGGTQYVVTGWSLTGNGPDSGAGTNALFTQTNNATLTWLWSTNYLLNATADANGSVTGSTNGWYAAGADVTVTGAPVTAGYHFAYWTGNVTGPTNSAAQTMAMDQARTVMAHFALDAVVLTIVSEHGLGTPGVGVYTNLYGTPLTNMMTGAETIGGTQYVVTGWSLTGNVPDSGAGTNAVFTQTNNATLTWLWSTNYYLNLTALNGTITNGTPGWKPNDALYDLLPVADNGYTFDHWEIDGLNVGAGVPLYVTIDKALTVRAIFRPIFVNVTSQIDWSIFWVFNPRYGYFIGTLAITNRLDSAKAMLAPIWYEVQSTALHWLRFPTGLDTNTGLYYLDISTTVNNQLLGIGNRDLYLDPGESVTVTDIQLMGRRTPSNDLVMAMWADPPGIRAGSVDTDGDGMSDVEEYIAGFNAMDPNSIFSIRLGSDGQSIQWDGKKNRLYKVLGSEDLRHGFIPVADNIAGVGAPAIYTPIPQAPGDVNKVFYKVDVRVKQAGN